MNKYFLKYLPIEGEIKEGDVFIEHGILYKLLAIREDDWVICTLNLQKQFAAVCKKPKKCKLFLCSRDIQVGDKFFFKGEEYVHVEQRDNIPYWIHGVKVNEEKVICFDSTQCFKIIGEISPEAKWVKEGDEFNQDEVYIYTPMEFDHYETYFDTETQQDEQRAVFKNRTEVQIKGPCGHFH